MGRPAEIVADDARLKKDKKAKKAKREHVDVVEEAPEVTKKEKKSKRARTETVSTEDTEVAAPVASEWLARNHIRVEGGDLAPIETFDAMADHDFPKRLWKACAKLFASPSAVQGAAWPYIMQRRDVCAIAKTGSGKTLGFMLPYLALSEKGTLTAFEQPSHFPRMVVMAPTRELAQQTEEVGKQFAEKIKGTYPLVCVVGGVPKWQQRQLVEQAGVDILVATPGRMQDLADEGIVDLSEVQFLVLDEADRMLDQGFVVAVRKLVDLMPKSEKRQTLCFSATWPTSVHRLAGQLMKKDAVTITVGSKSDDSAAGQEGQLRASEDVTQTVEVMQNGRGKPDRLLQILREHEGQKILIFGLYKKEVAWLESHLHKKGYSKTVALQGDMSQDKRTKAMEDFKSGKASPLVATDVAGRGLDVKGIHLVINYTFPLTVEDYVHRVGRTGRGGAKGKAITFFNVDGDHKEKEHAFGLMRVLETSRQTVPEALRNLAGTTTCATKKKEHPVYGKFFKDEAEMKKLEAQKVHVTFSDSD